MPKCPQEAVIKWIENTKILLAGQPLHSTLISLVPLSNIHHHFDIENSYQTDCKLWF
jgi:hypothetical protein